MSAVTPPKPPTSISPASFTGAIHSEWIKFRGLPSNTVIIVLTFILILANAMLMPWAYIYRDRSSPQADYAPYPEMIIDKTAYLGVLLAIWAALIITNEYRSRQIQTTVLSLPQRSPMLLAKVTLVTVIGFLAGVGSAGIGYAIAPYILAAGGYAFELTAADAVRLILGSGLYLAVFPLIGLALGTLIRHVVSAILSVLALTLLLPFSPQLVSSAGAEVSRYFPIQAGGQLLAPVSSGELDPWVGFIVLVAWSAVCTISALIVLKRRDV